MVQKGTIRSYISAPEWAGITEYLRLVAQRNSVELRITDVEEGSQRNTVYFVMEGEAERMFQTSAALSEFVEVYN